MALVFIDDLTEGMVLAEDLRTPSGRFVLAAGAEIKADQLQVLKSWGVIEADIDESSLGEGYLEQQDSIAECTDRAEAYLSDRFSLNSFDEEPTATLFRHVTHRCAQMFQRGWEPTEVPECPAVSDRIEGQSPPKVHQLLNSDSDIVSLPTVYCHIVELINRPNTSSHQLANVISKDASLTVRLLRLVNSPFYGFRSKIDSVSRAVSLLGLNELSSLALGITVVRQFQLIPSGLMDMESFWRHSIRCGLFARVLAGFLGEKDTEKYFTGGLLHDVGRLIMLEQMPLHYRKAIHSAREKHLPMYRAEQDRLKTDHSIIGKMLAEKWRLSPSLIRMIGSHHSPRLAHYSREACIVHFADAFAHACSDEILLINEIPEMQTQAWTEMGLSTEYIAAAIKQVDGEFQEIVKIFFDD